MKSFLGTYWSRRNRGHKLLGHLFSGRYKSPVVDGTSSAYSRTVCESVQLNPNPVRAKSLSAEQWLRDYLWRSWKEADLTKWRKGDPAQVRISRRLRQERTMTSGWIAQHLRMGVWTHKSNPLRAE